MLATGTALLIGSIISALAGAGAGVGQIIYNKNEAQRNRDFQERMSNTAIQRNIQDARNAGISPSLVLGGASTPMGATANMGNGLENALMNTTGILTDIIKQDRQFDFLEKMNNEKLEHETQIKMSNSANGTFKHNYSKEELNDLFDNFKEINWK